MNATEILTDLEKKAQAIPSDQVSALLIGLAGMIVRLAPRSADNAPHPQPRNGNRLLTAAQVAEKFAISKDRLYRHNSELKKCEVRIGSSLRYSEEAIEELIAKKRRANMG